ncbi:hypothetical protein [Haloferax sp. Atlit-19N]|uniref:hypothetical protein n=1 Tax=Haloferax sp. Atlit-19N TaxID=2077201 RepID=UPI0011C06931|nr:hypothetical protein [Haloferax sp. Atlit-19N]
MKRHAKGIVSIFCIALAYFSLVATTGIRATNDELLVVYDILEVLNSNKLSSTDGYFAGRAYQILISSVVRISGLSYLDLNLLSPLLGATSLAVIVLLLARIFYISSEEDSAISVFTLGAALLCFAGFANRLQETTHKKFTYVLVFLSIYLLYTMMRGDQVDRRKIGLLTLYLIGLSSINYIWGGVYTSMVVTILFLNYFRWGEGSPRISPAKLIPAALTVFIIPNYLPLIRFHTAYIRTSVLSFIAGVGTETTSAGASSKVGAWPTIDILGSSVTVWLFYVSGILFVGLITAVVGVLVLSRYIKYRGKVASPEVIFLGASIVLGGLGIALIATGGLATFKRIIIVPGLLGVLLSTKYLIDRNRLISVRLLMILLVLSSILAVPRVQLNGGQAPYDNYAQDSDIRTVQFFDNYDSSCAVTSDVLFFISPKLNGETTTRTAMNNSEDIIYSAGTRKEIQC